MNAYFSAVFLLLCNEILSFRYDVYTIDNLLNNERSYGGAPVADGR